MSRTLEIPDLSEEALRYLETRATEERLTIEEVVRRDVEAMATRQRILDDLASLPPVDLGGTTAADLIREGREERDRQIDEWLSRKKQ